MKNGKRITMVPAPPKLIKLEFTVAEVKGLHIALDQVAWLPSEYYTETRNAFKKIREAINE